MVVKLRPVDRVILGYVSIVSVVAITRLPETPSAAWVLFSNLLVGLLILLVRGATLGRVGRALADLYPVCILLSLYGALDVLAGYGSVRTYDDVVQRWEFGLFGSQISRDWSRQSPSALWSTVLHAAYFSYYLVVPAGPIWFLVKRDRKNLERLVLALMAVFVLCYLTFIFFPVAGPYHTFPPPSPEFLDNGPARLVYRILSGGNSFGAAFPSSHVAAALTASLVTLMVAPAFGVLLLVPSLLLTVGVVYCQMHYVVDAMAGVVVASITVAVVAWGARADHQRSQTAY